MNYRRIRFFSNCPRLQSTPLIIAALALMARLLSSVLKSESAKSELFAFFMQIIITCSRAQLTGNALMLVLEACVGRLTTVS